MKRVAFYTLGCKVNQYDTQTLVRLFKERGYQEVDFHEEADVYAINTCTVTAVGDKKSRQAIRRAIRRNPEAVILVTGCYAQTQPEEILKIQGVDVVIGTGQRGKAVDLVEERIEARAARPICLVGDIEAEYEDLKSEPMKERVRAYIKIQDGCEYFCSYCKIPYARGPMRSRPMDSILEEAREVVDSGVREIVLTGIHLGAYGKDIGDNSSLASVMTQLNHLPDLLRIRLGSIEPMDISHELIHTIEALPKACKHLHIPLQSGDDKILQAMRRTYNTREFMSLVEDIRAQIPDCAITTDVIVGFPGEDSDSFERTYEFVRRVAFSRLHVFKFSRRPGTPAALFPDQVSFQLKDARLLRLSDLGKELASSFHQRLVGREAKILVEKCEGGRIDGLTTNYVRAWAHGDMGDVSREVSLNINSADEEGLQGEILR
jgi:threonylcarbamoyladenosine tRNA methylthiotransferase MtaB